MEKKILKLFILMIGVFFIGISGVKASFTITYEGDNTRVLNNAILDSLIKTHFRLTDDNRTVYCYDGYVSYLEQTATYDSCERVTTNTAELAYIFENGYGRNNNYSIGNKYDDYFITQIALWYFAGRTNSSGEDLLKGFDPSGGRLTGTFRGKSNTLTQKVAEFVNDTLDISSNYSLSLTASNKELTATSDGKYYISDPIKISGSNVASTVSVTVTGANGAFVTTNKDATSGSSSFTLGNTIYIKVPIASVGTSTSLKLSASSKSTVASGTLTRCVNSENYAYQGLVDYTEGSKPTATANLTFTASKIINVTISKRSITGTDELPGATLVIKKGDDVIKTITSTTSSTSVTLDPGEYTLEETVAPEGQGILKALGRGVKGVMLNQLADTNHIGLGGSGSFRGGSLGGGSGGLSGGGGGGRRAAGTAGSHGQQHQSGHDHSEKLFHNLSLLHFLFRKHLYVPGTLACHTISLPGGLCQH